MWEFQFSKTAHIRIFAFIVLCILLSYLMIKITFLMKWMWTYWLNNIDNIISEVSSGRFVKNRIWLGGCSALTLFRIPAPGIPCPISLLGSLFFFFFPSSVPLGSFGRLGRSWNVPLLFAIISLSIFEYWILCKIKFYVNRTSKLCN